uniref:Uncharacterized protein n=3 Tax=Lygus hesperus TaxID=30085 RepID=A0A0A9XFA8_LYGHE
MFTMDANQNSSGNMSVMSNDTAKYKTSSKSLSLEDTVQGGGSRTDTAVIQAAVPIPVPIPKYPIIHSSNSLSNDLSQRRNKTPTSMLFTFSGISSSEDEERDLQFLSLKNPCPMLASPSQDTPLMFQTCETPGNCCDASIISYLPSSIASDLTSSSSFTQTQTQTQMPAQIHSQPQSTQPLQTSSVSGPQGKQCHTVHPPNLPLSTHILHSQAADTATLHSSNPFLQYNCDSNAYEFNNHHQLVQHAGDYHNDIDTLTFDLMAQHQLYHPRGDDFNLIPQYIQQPSHSTHHQQYNLQQQQPYIADVKHTQNPESGVASLDPVACTAEFYVQQQQPAQTRCTTRIVDGIRRGDKKKTRILSNEELQIITRMWIEGFDTNLVARIMNVTVRTIQRLYKILKQHHHEFQLRQDMRLNSTSIDGKAATAAAAAATSISADSVIHPQHHNSLFSRRSCVLRAAFDSFSSKSPLYILRRKKTLRSRSTNQ